MDRIENEIMPGDHVIVQRQGYTKLHKMKKQGTMKIGKFNVHMDNAIGQKYFDTFQMKNSSQNKKVFVLEKVEEKSNVINSLNIEKSGKDNRNIILDGDSQALTKDDIDRLQDTEFSANAIIGELVSNSKTFNMKTEYSQEKYIKKKEKKYFEYIQIRRPTIRLLANMFYRHDPAKTLGIRIDDLSQILTYANIHPDGNHLLYDSGTSGLMPAAIMNAIGPSTSGKLIHMHPGNECQKNAFIAMQFPEEQRNRCINVNLYSVLRHFYQNKDKKKCEQSHTDLKDSLVQTSGKTTITAKLEVGENSSFSTPYELDMNKRKNNQTDELRDEPSHKRQKVEGNCENQNKESGSDNKLGTENAKKVPQWHLDNEMACKILKNKCDSLIVTAKEHPVNLVKELLQFLNGARQIVVFSLTKEPLQELFLYLKSRLDIVAIRLSNNFMRYYQVLPERTHPEVNMNSGGYILSAVKLNC